MNTPSDTLVSLTTFDRFCNTDPSGQFIVARNAHRMYMEEDFGPRIDFWKRFRDTVVLAHAQPDQRDRRFDALSIDLPDNKRSAYPTAIAGYKKWWGRKDITLIERPAPVPWGPHLIKFKVNPELVLDINGELTVAKLYYSKDGNSMTRRNADLITHLLEQTHGTLGTAMVIDVKKGKGFKARPAKPGIPMTLIAQSAAFSSFWMDLAQGRMVS